VKTTAVFSLGETNPTEVGEWSIPRQKALAGAGLLIPTFGWSAR